MPATHTGIPTLADLTSVYLAINVEVWPDWPDGHNLPVGDDGTTLTRYIDRVHTDTIAAIDRARTTIRDYLNPLHTALPDGDPRHDLVDDNADDIVRSQHTSDILCVEGSAHLTLTPDEWRTAADRWCLDLDWSDQGRIHDPAHIPALPADRIVPTLGMLAIDGLIPAVAIEHTDEGYGWGATNPPSSPRSTSPSPSAHERRLDREATTPPPRRTPPHHPRSPHRHQPLVRQLQQPSPVRRPPLPPLLLRHRPTRTAPTETTMTTAILAAAAALAATLHRLARHLHPTIWTPPPPGTCPTCHRQAQHECDTCGLPWTWCPDHCCRCHT